MKIKNYLIRAEKIKLFLSLLIVFMVYSFGNFGFLNLFNIKFKMQALLLILAFFPLSIITFYHIKKEI